MLEFGTKDDLAEVIYALWQANREKSESNLQALRECFNPSGEKWQQSVIDRGVAACLSAISMLNNKQPSASADLQKDNTESIPSSARFSR